jgi:hypothetical protein
MDAPEQSAVRLAARQTTQRAVETAIFWESTVEGRGPKFRQSPSAKCAGSGKAEKVNGGYHITARKIFVSGAPTGDLLMTGTVLECDGEQKRARHLPDERSPRHIQHAVMVLQQHNTQHLFAWIKRRRPNSA